MSLYTNADLPRGTLSVGLITDDNADLAIYNLPKHFNILSGTQFQFQCLPELDLHSS